MNNNVLSNAGIQSNYGYHLALILISALLMFGKAEYALSLHVANYDIRLPQLILLLSVWLLVKHYNLFLDYYFVTLYALSGCIFATLGYMVNPDLHFILSNVGIFFYAGFFYLAYISFDSVSKMVNLFYVMLFSWLIGAFFFIFCGYYELHVIPFKVKLSSDLLPMLAPCLFLIGYCLRHQYCLTSSISRLMYFPILFIIMTMSKMVLLSFTAVFFLFLLFSKRYPIKINAIRLLKVTDYRSSSFIVFITMLVRIITMLPMMSATHFYSFISFYTPPTTSQYIQTLYTGVYIRAIYWHDVFFQILHNLFLPHGIIPFSVTTSNSYLDQIGSFSSANINPHCSYLLLLYYGGFPIGLIFIFMQRHFFKKLISMPPLAFSASLAFLLYLINLYFLLNAVTTPVFEIYYLAPFYWIFLGIFCRVCDLEYKQ